ncbi:hypothetical protein VEE01_16780 [Escherichia coli]|nr:hypothetical protein VEE01_16780 [Escherichia coli]
MPIWISDVPDKPIAIDGSISIGFLLVASKNKPLKKSTPSSQKVNPYMIMIDVI